MLMRFGDDRDTLADCHLAWSLAGIAGALNAAGFYAVGFYSSNMSGNVSALGDHLALAELRVAGTYLALVVIFIFGAAVSGLLINVGRRRRVEKIYAYSILAEAVLLALLATADLWLTGGFRGPALAFGLSFLMGLQNAVVTRISNARVRTTHVTGMVTDIGIELGNLTDLLWHRRARGEQDAEAAYNGEKLRLHGFTVLSFLGGGVFGVVAYRWLGAYLLFGLALFLLGLAAPGVIARRVAVVG